MRRRDFLRRTGAALAASALASCRAHPDWASLRLVASKDLLVELEKVLRDVASLLRRATGADVAVVEEEADSSGLEIVVRRSSDLGLDRGGFRLSRPETSVFVVDGADVEGARNGLYAFLEELGFAFFRDGDAIPRLEGPALVAPELVGRPAFRLRGDMIWDNYLGPGRFCSAMWGIDEWERALLYLARNRMNFLELYPPLDEIMAIAFPEAKGLERGGLLPAYDEHELAKSVLARGRALGIRFMYVLTYGAFPEPVRDLYPKLEWRNGFLCAHQPELSDLTERVWRALVDELGTDHWYAIRHRGEEDQAYGDPCRSVGKSAGFLQAFSVLETIDPDAAVTVWTWGEKLPELFRDFPERVRAAHIRHGMAGVFASRGEGREQEDGAPVLEPRRKWLSGQFTVFGGNETVLQTARSDVSALARDASVSAKDEKCEGYFQWPEWSDTSPWLSHAIAKISWDPESFLDLERRLELYAKKRHAERSAAFLRGFLPLLRDGNAKFSYPPRKRLLVPWLLASESLDLLAAVREGARAMQEVFEGAPPLFVRDALDLVTWVARRQAETFEAQCYRLHLASEPEGSARAAAFAEQTWRSLFELLSAVPELSIVASAKARSRDAPLGEKAVDLLWTLGCDFYHGYPLVLSPEAIELVYLPQLEALGRRLDEASSRGAVAALEEPGWFWHDFPDRRWADAVRKLPSEESERFEREMRGRLLAAVGGGADSAAPTPRNLDARFHAAVAPILSLPLPPPSTEPPVFPAAGS